MDALAVGGVVGGHLGAVLVRGRGGPHQQEDVGGGQSQQGGQHGGELVGDRGGEEVTDPGGQSRDDGQRPQLLTPRAPSR